MTNPNLPVSQEDREAAAEVLSAMGFSQVTDQDTRAGLRDHWLPVQAFAAHRQRAIAQADAAGYRRAVEEAAELCERRFRLSNGKAIAKAIRALNKDQTDAG